MTLHPIFPICIYIHISTHNPKPYIHIYTYTYMCIYIHIYVYRWSKWNFASSGVLVIDLGALVHDLDTFAGTKVPALLVQKYKY